MRRDFTLSVYKNLLCSLKEAGYEFQTFQDFLVSPKSKVIILRHDVDLKPQNSLQTAIIENEFGIQGSYYFLTSTMRHPKDFAKNFHRKASLLIDALV